MDPPETPRRPVRQRLTSPNVRRNLSFDFDEGEVERGGDGMVSPCRTSGTPRVNSPEERRTPSPSQRTPVNRSGCAPRSPSNVPVQRIPGHRYRGFILKWIIVLFCVASCVGIVYYRYPNHMLVCFTKEFIVLGTLVILLLITFSLVVKLLQSPVLTDLVQNFSHGTDTDSVNVETPTREGGELSYTDDNTSRSYQIPLKRTFSGNGKDIWSEYIRYFENVANLNGWTTDRTLRIFFTVLRGQAEVYAYGLSDTDKQDWEAIKNKMNSRFGHISMKESYVAEAKLRKRKSDESYRDFAQTIEDLYRRAYPDNREYVEESSLKTFLNNCNSSDNFRLAVKRMRPKTIQEAVTFAMQEEYILLGEKTYQKDHKRSVYQVQKSMSTKQPGNGDAVRHAAKETQILKCFECGSEKHLRNRCPDVKRKVNPNKTQVQALNETRLEQ